MHPEIPRRLNWLEREMGSLAEKLDDTRTDLEKAMGQDWAREDPSWAPSLVDQSFPVDIRDALARPPGSPAVERGPFIERDLGPDLGMGL